MNRRAMIVIFSVIIVILIVVLIWGITANGRNDVGFFGWGFGSSDLSTATTFEQAAEDVKTIDLQLGSQDVHFTRTEGNMVEVEQIASANIPEREKIRVGMRGSTLVVSRNASVGGWIGCGPMNQFYTSVEIRVPRNAVVELRGGTGSGEISVGKGEYGDCNLSAASGSILFEGVSMPVCSLDTASGDINAEDCRFESLDCNTASGSVEVEAETTGSVKVHTASGSQRYLGSCDSYDGNAASGDIYVKLTGAVDAKGETASGNVDFEFLETGRLQLVDVETASGSVAIAMPQQSRVTLDYNSFSGDLKMEENSFQIGGSSDAIKLKVDTASGDLILRGISTETAPDDALHGRQRDTDMDIS